MLQEPHDLIRKALGIAAPRTLPGQFRKGLLRGLPRFGDLVGVLIGQFLQREPEAISDLHRARQSVGVVLEQALHLGRGLQGMALLAFPPQTELVDRAFKPCAGHDVLQRLALGDVEQDVVRHAGGHAGGGREGEELVKAQRIAGR